MRLHNPLKRRLEELETVLKPKGRLFVFVDMDGDPATYAERLASFHAENGVLASDELVAVRLTYR